MKFTRINEDYQVLSVEIKNPEEYSNITYYYPDGITKGLFRRKTYIASITNFLSGVTYYESLEDIVKDYENLIILDGKIYSTGKVYFTIKDIEEPIVFKYKTRDELKEFLENLSFKYSFPLQNFISLEDKNIISLYEYKESLD